MNSPSRTLVRELKDVPPYLWNFLRNPVDGIKTTPTWSWPALLSIQAGIAIISGVMLGLFSLSFLNLLLGLVIFPLTCLVTGFVFTVFLNYFFSLFARTFLDLQRLYTVVVLATLPYLLFHVVSGFLPPIDLIGFGFTCLLLIVGLIEQFRLDRKLVFRLMIGVYLLFGVIWSISQFRTSPTPPVLKGLTPQSLDHLEMELGE